MRNRIDMTIGDDSDWHMWLMEQNEHKEMLVRKGELHLDKHPKNSYGVFS